MFNFFKGLLGYYKGYQRTTPQIAITKKTTVPLVDNVMQIPGVWCCVNKIVNTMAALPCDVLKVGHHGSSSSSAEEFISEAYPEYAVISCGEGNEYGHPHRETLELLDGIKAEVLRTDKLGTIVISTDGENINVE